MNYIHTYGMKTEFTYYNVSYKWHNGTATTKKNSDTKSLNMSHVDANRMKIGI